MYQTVLVMSILTHAIHFVNAASTETAQIWNKKGCVRFLKEETKNKEKIFTKIPFCDKIVAKFYACLRTGAHHVVVVCLSPRVVNHI